jgi:hypothetical protein
MEVKPGFTPYVAPAPVLPAAPMPMPMPMPMPAPVPHHDHIHLHAAYKHTTVLHPTALAPVVPFTSTASILVLFILLVIITRSFFFKC